MILSCWGKDKGNVCRVKVLLVMLWERQENIRERMGAFISSKKNENGIGYKKRGVSFHCM